MEHSAVGTASSLARAPFHLRPGHPSGHLKPPTRCQARRGALSEHHTCNVRHSGCCDLEWHILNLDGPGPKALGSNVHDVCFPKCF
jgi:hypothetical protein